MYRMVKSIGIKIRLEVVKSSKDRGMKSDYNRFKFPLGIMIRF